MSQDKLITIDGPSASGKSSVSRLVASKLSWRWVSTGAFYRGLAFVALEKGLDADQKQEIVQLAESQDWSVELTAQNTLVRYADQDVTSKIEGEEVGGFASQISQIPEVRAALLERQRRCFDPDKGLVAEGRDCGTVVFPQAPLKIYLTANPALRAARRSEEQAADLSKTEELVKKRDAQDSQRKVAPLKMAKGAFTIDSSDLSLEDVANQVIEKAQSLGL